METQSPIVVTEQNGIVTLTLNQPQRYNPLSVQMLEALQAQVDCIAHDDSLRVVVIAAEGPAFCAGHDLKQMRANPEKAYQKVLFERCSHFMLSLLKMPQPVIARVQGVATAAGCQLVATCDMAVASSDARFAVSGVNLGLFCSTPAVALSRNVARKKAMQMLLTGEFIDASTALEYGLVNRVVAPDALDSAISELTASITAKSAVATSTGKRMFYQQLEQGVSDAYSYASETMACNMLAADAQEGIDAFIEKRTPEWRHR